jgi:Tol biopolymer transport system component
MNDDIMGPHYDPFLCVINADGTGFQKLMNLNSTDLSYSSALYITSGGQLIFEADRFYITDPDSIYPIPITSGFTAYRQGLELSNDNKGYFCSYGDLYQYDFATHTQTNLTTSIDGSLNNPVLSPDDSIITLVKHAYDSTHVYTICYYNLMDGSFHEIPQAGDLTDKGIYSPLNNKLYIARRQGLYKVNLDGTDNTQLLSGYFKQLVFDRQKTNLISVASGGLLVVYNIFSELTIQSHQIPDPLAVVKFPRKTNKLFYATGGSVYYYDIDNQNTTKIPNISGIVNTMCPTWDGSKIYYIANLRLDK